MLTIVSDAASYDFAPKGNVPIGGLGDGAYWEQGTHQVVVRIGQNVLQVVDDVPVDGTKYSTPLIPDKQAAQALATKIVAHLS